TAGYNALVFNVAFGPEGKILLILVHDKTGTVRRWDATTLRELTEATPIEADKLVLSPDLRTLVGKARLWDVTTGRSLGTLPLPPGGFGPVVVFTPDGQTVVGVGDRLIRAYDLRAPDEPDTRHPDGPLAVEKINLTADGQTALVSFFEDRVPKAERGDAI